MLAVHRGESDAEAAGIAHLARLPHLEDLQLDPLVPVNLPLNVASNTLAMVFNVPAALLLDREPSNLWPIVSVLGLVWGPIGGVQDSFEGRAFWNPPRAPREW